VVGDPGEAIDEWVLVDGEIFQESMAVPQAKCTKLRSRIRPVGVDCNGYEIIGVVRSQRQRILDDTLYSFCRV
jgi:hypothetical protein